MTATLGGLEGFGGRFAALLLTYWVHSTLLLGSAWILGRWVLKREAWRDVMWKAALVGGLVTTAASALPIRPWAARLSVPLLDAQGATAARSHTGREDVSGGAGAPLAGQEDLSHGTSAPLSAQQDPTRAPTPSASPGPSPSPSIQRATESSQQEVGLATRSTDELPAAAFQQERIELTTPSLSSRAFASLSTLLQGATGLLLLGWLLASALLLGGFVRRHAHLRHILRDRRPVVDGPLPAILAGLRRSTGVWHPVRLTTTPSVATPLALGRSEICVPDRFLDRLGEEEQKAALAHELGHLVRRDPAWNLAAQLMEVVFFFQPLHRVARARLRESAEYLADAWAVHETGSRLGLARCLAEVADWVSAVETPDLAGTLAMAEGGSPLLARVRRLLEGEPEAAHASPSSRAAAFALIALTAGFAPAFSSDATPLSAAAGEREVVEGTLYESQGAQPEQTVEVVRVPETGTLAERMRSAESMAESSGARAYWLAYVMEGAVKVGEDVGTDTGPSSWPDGGPAVEGLLRVAPEVGPAGSGDLIVLVQQAPATGRPRIVRLALRSPGLGIDLQGRPVYWLGRAEPSQSFAWANDVFRDDRHAEDIRQTAIDVLSRHALPEARQVLEQLATSRSELQSVRQEAIEGLANHPADATVELLARLATNDSDPSVKAEAAETLGEVDNPLAGSALETLLRGSAASDIKEEALEALSERGDTLLAGLLLELALRDPDPDMRIEAVEGMQELSPEVALPLLQRVVAESTNRDVRVEAAETIGELGTPEALAALDALLGDRDPEVAIKAVEAIGEFPADVSGPRLARLAREHPSAEVREEALDQLSDIDSSALMGDVLIELALTAPDSDVRQQAVEQMEDLIPEEALALLGRVVSESRDPETQRQAVESLADVPITEALQLLDRIARENPNEAIARQAVESMGEFPEDLAGPLLRRIATEHRSVRVRREALSQLGGYPLS